MRNICVLMQRTMPTWRSSNNVVDKMLQRMRRHREGTSTAASRTLHLTMVQLRRSVVVSGSEPPRAQQAYLNARQCARMFSLRYAHVHRAMAPLSTAVD